MTRRKWDVRARRGGTTLYLHVTCSAAELHGNKAASTVASANLILPSLAIVLGHVSKGTDTATGIRVCVYVIM